MALMNPKNKEEEEENIHQMQTDVTDEEMALRYRLIIESPVRPLIAFFFIIFRYESLIGSIKKKFAKKRHRAVEAEEDLNQNQNVEAKSKRVFLKPQD